MKRLHSNVGSTKSALQQRPKVLDPLSVNLSAHVLFYVVHRLVYIVPSGKVVIDRSTIRVDRRTAFDLIQNLVLQGLALHVGNHLRPHLTALTVEHSHDNSGSLVALIVHLEPFRAVHLLRLWADVRLVYFDRATVTAAHLEHQSTLHRFADAMQHEPCRVLADTKRLSQLITADPVLAVRDHPESGHPLIESERGILKDGADFYRELLFADVAEPNPAGLDKRVFRLITARTKDISTGPAKLYCRVKGALRIGKVGNGSGKCSRNVHKKMVRLKHMCVNRFIAAVSYTKQWYSGPRYTLTH